MQLILFCLRTGTLLTPIQREAPGLTQLHRLSCRQGISTWLSTRNPLAWKQLCAAVVFPLCFSSVPLDKSLSSDRTPLKDHKLCVCRTSGTNLCHPSAAAHERGLQSCGTMPLCQCPPCNDSSHTSLPIPGHPEDRSSCSTLILGSWAAAVGMGVISLLVCTVFSERQQ